MESENIEEINQEGGQPLSPLNGSTRVNLTGGVSLSLQEISTIPLRTNRFLKSRFTLGGISYLDRPLLLSDLTYLIAGGGPFASGASVSTAETDRKREIQTLFDNVPLAQYKHLPDINALSMAGGSIDETQEVSLPSDEEVLPSLDIIEPNSTGGSYKRSSHKKRKSTRIRTKKNKKL